MLPVAVLIFPGKTFSLSDEGIVKLRSNISGPSAMLSVATEILIVVLVVPAVKVAVIGVVV